MKIFPEKVSRALSAAYLAAAVLSGGLALSSLADLITILDFYSAPVLLPFMHGAVQPVNMPPLAQLMVRHSKLFFAFFPLFWLSACVLALGLLRRAEWARRGAAAMLYLLAAAALLVFLYPWLVVPRPLMYGEVSLAPAFNAGVRVAAYLARLLAFAAGGLCLWWGLALDRGRARAEFKAPLRNNS